LISSPVHLKLRGIEGVQRLTKEEKGDTVD
jgi:hypothetical protein